MSIYFDLEILPTALATLLLAATVALHVAGSVLDFARTVQGSSRRFTEASDRPE